MKVFPHLPTDASCRDRLLCASPCASFALGVPLPSLGWGKEGLEVSEGSLVFLQKTHKSHFSFPSVPCVPMSSAVRDQNTPCIRSQLPPTQFTCRSATPFCPQDTSHLSFHSVYFGFHYFLATEGKEEASAAESTSRVLQGKPGERSSVPYSAGQFFFEYLVVVSLKKTPGGHYEPKITYQFPKVFSLLFLRRRVF